MTTPAGASARDSRLPGASPPGAATSGAAAPSMTGPTPDEAVTVMYQDHYATLVRVAALLVGDPATAEGVVQDSFVAMHRAWWRLRDTSKALAYLHRSVIKRSRSMPRHRMAVDRHLPPGTPKVPSAEDSARAGMERSSLLAALSALSSRQREVAVLRYYADLSEAQIAAAMGISEGAVKAHAARARDSLHATLG